ncbi:MAG: hypothetical protein DRJ47_03320 [Thermoprotei archaeon]|nr:MAG: hypothetical protein DRJ47_03320 [Thermoprotei archaeon]
MLYVDVKIFLLVLLLLVSSLGIGNLYLVKGDPASLELNKEFREYLLELARDTWNFFVRYTNNDTGLPYDRSTPGNPQTSITNIGLYMASVVAAWDLGFINRSEALQRLRKTIDTLFKLEKWHGIPFNWYDADTLKPIWGNFVSSVDAGWYAAGLIVARSAFPELYDNLTALIDMMEWDRLYDPDAKLLYIGFDSLKRKYTQAHYDYITIESRMASFIAIGTGKIPAEHWFALKRDLQYFYNISFMWGWNGGLFIYYMPGIFIDERGSSIANSAINVTLAQIMLSELSGYPVWGFSPSDIPQGGYGMKFDVVTPHASVLALIYFPEETLLNLLKLEKMGVRSTYGFKDSVSMADGSVDEDYLALDQGMIFLTIANYLNNSIWKFFEKDPIAVKARKLVGEYNVPESMLKLYRFIFVNVSNIVLEKLLEEKPVFSAIRTLRLAKLYFASGDHEKAWYYANKTLEEINSADVNSVKNAVSKILAEAENSILSARRENRTSKIAKAASLYNSSLTEFNEGKYTSSFIDAVVAKFYAKISRPTVVMKRVKLTLTSDKEKYIFPCNVTLRGTINPRLPVNIIIESYSRGSWKVIAIVKADKNGVFTFTWQPESGNYTVRARSTSYNYYLPSQSNHIKISVLKGERKLRLNYTKTAYVNENVSVTGEIDPPDEAENVSVKIVNPKGQVSHTTVDVKNGAFALSIKPTLAGLWNITVTIPETENYKGVSKTLSINVVEKGGLNLENIITIVFLAVILLISAMVFKLGKNLKLSP